MRQRAGVRTVALGAFLVGAAILIEVTATVRLGGTLGGAPGVRYGVVTVPLLRAMPHWPPFPLRYGLDLDTFAAEELE